MTFIPEASIIQRERRLPLPGDVLVRKGDIVQPTDAIARSELVPGNPYVVDICRELGVPYDQLDNCLLVKPGDKVSIGMAIARAGEGRNAREVKAQADGVVEFVSRAYSRVLIREQVREDHPLITIEVTKKLGMPAWQIRSVMRVKEEDEVKQGSPIAYDSAGSFVGMIHSPVSGIVEKICGRTGMVTIRRPYRPTLLHAFIPGRVTEVIPSYGAIVEGAGNVYEGVFGLGGEAFGDIRVVCAPDEVLGDHDITSKDADRVLIGGCSITSEAIRKAIAVGVRGVVVGGIDIETLENLGVGIRGITGSESLGIVLVVMHGFGKQALDKKLHDAAAAFSGTASLSGATQMRSRVKHPELLLCSNDWLDAAKEMGSQSDREVLAGVDVRVLMGPNMGRQATVVEVLREPARLPSGEMATCAQVRMGDGSESVLPIASLRVVV